MTIKIVSDSTCDISPELIEKYNIGILPLYVTMNNKTGRDNVDIFPKDIFEYVDNGGEICSTAAVNVNDYLEAFNELSVKNDAVINICIGSGFSSCYQNACIAAEQFSNVYVVDSCNLSSGQGHIVVCAALMAEAGMQPDEICTKLKDLTSRVEASFLIDRLDYMCKGGRCSAVAALGANLLKIKPCIEVIDGKMRVVKKYRGPFERCIEAYVKDRLDGRSDIVNDRIFITHPSATPKSVETARNAISKYKNFSEIIETRAGCTVSAHCGPNTLGVLFIRKGQ